MDNFIIGWEETCIMDNATEDLRGIGSADVKKHENNVDDCRGYITLYRTGTPAGSTGPTVLLLKGKIPSQGFNYKFLMKYGAALG